MFFGFLSALKRQNSNVCCCEYRYWGYCKILIFPILAGYRIGTRLATLQEWVPDSIFLFQITGWICSQKVNRSQEVLAVSMILLWHGATALPALTQLFTQWEPETGSTATSSSHPAAYHSKSCQTPSAVFQQYAVFHTINLPERKAGKTTFSLS